MKYEAHITIGIDLLRKPPKGWKKSAITGWDAARYLTAHGNNYRALLKDLHRVGKLYNATQMKIEEIKYDVRR